MKKLFNIQAGDFKEVVRVGLSLDMIYIIERVLEGEDVSSFTDERISGIIQTLRRKGYISETSLVTESGKALHSSLLEENKSLKLKKVTAKTEEWQTFLAVYPVNNTFIWKGKKFDGDRGIRKNTDAGKLLFTKILNEGEYTVSDLCNAVVAESIQKMESSWKSGENKMKYFVNTESYLRQRGFENFIEEGRELTETQIMSYKEAFNRKSKSINKSNSISI